MDGRPVQEKRKKNLGKKNVTGKRTGYMIAGICFQSEKRGIPFLSRRGGDFSLTERVAMNKRVVRDFLWRKEGVRHGSPKGGHPAVIRLGREAKGGQNLPSPERK